MDVRKSRGRTPRAYWLAWLSQVALNRAAHSILLPKPKANIQPSIGVRKDRLSIGPGDFGIVEPIGLGVSGLYGGRSYDIP